MNCACGLGVWQLCYNNNNHGRKGKDRWTQLLSLSPSLLLIPLAYFEHRQNSIAVIIDLCIALIQECVETNLLLCSHLYPKLIPASPSLPSSCLSPRWAFILLWILNSSSLVSLAGVLFRLLSFFIIHLRSFLLLCPFLCFPSPDMHLRHQAAPFLRNVWYYFSSVISPVKVGLRKYTCSDFPCV